MKKENILLIIDHLHSGGAQKSMAEISIALAEYYAITLIIHRDFDKIDFDYAGELLRIQLPYSTDSLNNNLFKRCVRLFSLTRQLNKIKRKRKIGVAISFMEVSNIANILSWNGEKQILSVRSYLSKEFQDNKRLNIFRTFIKLLYKRSKYVVTPSEQIKTDMIVNFGLSGERIRVINNFIDSELIENKKKEKIEPEILNLLEQHQVLINVGRLASAKAQWLLAGVLRQVMDVVPKAKLIIMGEGPLRGKLVASAIQQGLKVYQQGIDPLPNMTELSDYDVFLLGFKKNPFPYLTKSEVFILSSLYEGFPNVLVEAMQCGLPVISSDCFSGPREILNPSTDIPTPTKELTYAEYGILTKVADSSDPEQYTNAAAKAAIEILTNPQKKKLFRNQSLSRAPHFYKKTILQQWIQLIED